MRSDRETDDQRSNEGEKPRRRDHVADGLRLRHEDNSVTKARPASSERIFMPWFWLIVGGLFEVGFTTSLRFVDGFRNLPWTLAFLASVAVSMALLEVASRSIPMGTAYAVWGGIGAVGTVIVGILWFHEPSSMVRLLLILTIVAAIAALRLTA
jgi:quaternary ammonium compound-resistance protein SugE